MYLSRRAIRKNLQFQLNKNRKLIGAAVGNGLSAKYAEKGGADFILALNSGKFRQMGHGSLAGFLPYVNCNEMVMDFGQKELLTNAKKLPVFFGLCATDPTINLDTYIDHIIHNGFSGIINYPSVGLLDGNFRNALTEDGISYDTEIQAIRLAHEKDIFTVAFVFNQRQAIAMTEAGADVLCLHLGLTKGGLLGAKSGISLKNSIEFTNAIFRRTPHPLKMIYGGPLNTPSDVQYFYDNTNIDGYIGGSSLERIPLERHLTNITAEFKQLGSHPSCSAASATPVNTYYDYVEFIQAYIADHYQEEISFNQMSDMLHISRTYLSSLFKKDTGYTFPEYLTNYRINKAIEILRQDHSIQFSDLAAAVGYLDYAHFSKTFKKVTGKSPKEFLKSIWQ